jgi:ATP-dependent helicase/nuclease subunit B
MALQFVAGPSGSGKSYYLYKTITEEARRNPDERFLFMVPEQFTMQTQKELVKAHPNHALLNIDIISFNRLAYRVFEETGYASAPILEDTGKILVLQKILNDNRDELQILGKMYDKIGAAAKVNSLLSEFTQYRVDVSEVRNTNKKLPELLNRKLKDIEIISEKFSEYMRDKYLTAEEVPAVLSTVIENYKELDGATVVFDGFTGFVPTQMLVVEKLLKMCKKVIVSVTTDRAAGVAVKSSPSNLFHMTHQMVENLLKAAANAGAEALKTVYIEPSEKSRFKKNSALSFLENKLFRYEYKKYEKDQQSIFIGEARSPRKEIEAAAQVISRLVRCEGYRYRDFAFVSGDLETYGENTRQIFEENDIPCFLDQKQSIMSNAAVEFIRAAIDIASDDFSYKSVFRFLKSGMTEFTADEISLFETYVIANGVKGYRNYLKKWERLCSTIDGSQLEIINDIRGRFTELIREYIEEYKVRNATVRERSTAVYGLLVSCKIQDKCEMMADEFESRGELSKAKEYRQIFKMIIDFFEKYVEILGDEKVSAQLYSQMADAGFEDMRLGIIPPNQDQVVIGDIERTRLKDIKVMFFAGLNDGIVPKPADKANILSETDRKVLSDMDIELAPDARSEMYRQRLYLYLNMTKPSEKLYLSYSMTSMGGDALQPSYLINVIREMFPGISIMKTDSANFSEKIETYTGRNELLLEGFEKIEEKTPENDFLELVSFFRQSDEGELIVHSLIDAVSLRKPDTNISAAAAKMIYGVNNSFSASRVECFGKCEFSHFLKYALQLKERDVFEFTAADIGNILHEAIKEFSNSLSDKDIDSLTKEEINDAADAAFEKAYQNGRNNADSSTSRAFDMMRLKMINRTTALCMVEQIRQSEFVPFAFEKEFVVNGVKGTIDRIDICKSDIETFLRIIDYKSSSRKLKLDQLRYGVQLQLPLYLAAAKDIVRPVVKGLSEAAGMYYYGMGSSMVEVNYMEQEVDDEKRISEFKLNGISRKEPEILRLLDKNLDGPGTSSNIINVSINKNDKKGDKELKLSKYSSVASADDFKNIEDYTRYLLKKFRKEIESGSAKIDPKEVAGSDSCEFCEFASICKFDEKIPGFRKLRCVEKTNEENIKLMIEELFGGNKNDGD